MIFGLVRMAKEGEERRIAEETTVNLQATEVILSADYEVDTLIVAYYFILVAKVISEDASTVQFHSFSSPMSIGCISDRQTKVMPLLPAVRSSPKPTVHLDYVSD